MAPSLLEKQSGLDPIVLGLATKEQIMKTWAMRNRLGNGML